MIRRHRVRIGTVVLVCLAGVVSTASVGSARAQTAEAPTARADRLFREGKAALEAGHYDEACPKLSESQRLDPGTGTLLALALCHEASGQTGSAWVEYTAVVQASQKRVDRTALAQQHLATLEQFVSRLTVTVTEGSSVTVRVDGVDLPQNRWGTSIPLDPGDHTVEASADALPHWKQTVHIGKVGEVKTIVVPNLAQAERSIALSPSSTWDRRSTGWVVGGAGAAFLGVGAVVGGLALASRSSAKSLCPSSACRNATGVSDNNRAETEAWVADFGVGIGLAGLGAAAYLLLVHDARPATASSTLARFVPAVGPGFAGISLEQPW